jgi:hypothetical protein
MNVYGWMVDTVTVASLSSTDVYGDRSYGSQSTIKARVEGGTKLVRGSNGEEVTCTRWFVTDATVDEASSYWLPGDSTGGVGRQAVSVKSAKTRDQKTTLTEVYFL